jgi:hypothetical protein
MSGVEGAMAARCPECGALAEDWHPYGRCSACKEQSGGLVASDGKQVALPVRPPARGGEPRPAGSGA